MGDDQNKNRGSEWEKWDLHLHSFYTSVNNQFSASTEDEYINKIVNEDIKVVGLTNYFNFSDNDWNLKTKLEQKKGLGFFKSRIEINLYKQGGRLLRFTPCFFK